MSPLILPSLLTSVSRQMSRAMQFAAVGCFSRAGSRHSIAHISGALAQTRAAFCAVRLPHVFHPGLLMPKQQIVALQPSAGMKTKSALKKRCNDCFFVRRRGRLYVFCKSHPRHKQRQG